MAAYAGDFSAWTYCSLLKLNTSSSGANVIGSVTNFPLLVRLTQSNFDFTQAKPDGSDVRFTANDPAANATELTFKIERWDNVNKLAEVWVKVPQILGNNNTQAIKMYWGNSGTLPPAPTAPVFTSADGYAGVWHLSENPGSTAGGYKDAVGSNNGTGNNGTSSVGGDIGNGVNFTSTSNQSITIPNAASAGAPSTFHPTGSLTVEAWINASSQGQYKRFVGKGFTSATNPWDEYDIQFSGASNTFAFVISMGSTQYAVTSTTATSTGQWYHVVGTYDQSNMRIYVNGSQECSVARTGTISDYGQGLTFGKYQNDNNSNFNGKLDEVRISFTARSSDWIALCYMNQRADQKLVEKQPASQFGVDPGVLLQKYNGISDGYNIASLTSLPQFPAGPSQTLTTTSMDWKWAATGDGSQDNNFGAKMSGWIQAPTTGNYTFWMRADDRGELWLSTDGNPVNKTRIAYVPDWDPYDNTGWTKRSEQMSAPISLQSGKLYYIEALMTQASGDAHMSVGWTMPSGVVEQPISAGRVFPSTFQGYAPAITVQPHDVSVVAGNTATFSVTAAPGKPATTTYEWRLGGIPIPGAASLPTYTTPITVSSMNQGVYSVKVGNGDPISPLAVLSNNVVLTVSTQANSNPPQFAFNFDEGTGSSIANTGTLGGSGTLTTTWPAWSTRAPINGTNALDFGNTSGDYGADFNQTNGLKSLTSFTISGWVNAVGTPVAGTGGNRIVSWVPSGVASGVDLAVRSDGSLGLGVNQWNDGDAYVDANGVSRPAGVGSSGGKITVAADGSFNNWRFFAVTYDATVNTNNVKFYFGSNAATATLDQAITYNAGNVGANISSQLTIGNMVHSVRSNPASSRMFQGLIDQIHIYTSTTDGSGAKTPAELATIQNAAPIMGRAGILYEEFDGIGGGSLKDLVASPSFPDNPSATLVRQSFSAPVNQGTNYGVKMSGWVQAPLSGDYTFWVAADDQAELRVSSDANPVNKVIVATVPSYTGDQEWTRYPTQQSIPITLVAGKLYYIEALMAQGSGSANLSVGWQLPAVTSGVPGTFERPISAGRLFLTPNEGDAFFPSAISLYEKGTSNKKATLAWSQEHFSISTEGLEKLSIRNDVLSTPNKFYLGEGKGAPEDLGFRYFKTDGTQPYLEIGTGDAKKAFTVYGVSDPHDVTLSPYVDFNQSFTMSGPNWLGEHNAMWQAGAALDYRYGLFAMQSHPNDNEHTNEEKTVILNTDSLELTDTVKIASAIPFQRIDNAKLKSSSITVSRMETASGILSDSRSVTVDAMDGIQYNSNTNGTVSQTTIDPSGVTTDVVHAKSMVITPIWKIEEQPVPDYVFENGYHLRTLKETEQYVKANKHLPEIPAAKEMEENGINVTEMNLQLLKKVEELTLQMIALDKELKSQRRSNEKLQKEMKAISENGKGH